MHCLIHYKSMECHRLVLGQAAVSFEAIRSSFSDDDAKLRHIGIGLDKALPSLWKRIVGVDSRLR